MINKINDKNDRQTPPEFFNKFHKYFKFNTDLACTPENCLCNNGFCKDGYIIDGVFHRDDHNSLSEHTCWRSIIAFLNAPFSRDKESETCLKDWIRKAYWNKYDNIIFMMLPNKPGNSAWQEYILPEGSANFVINLSQRIKYLYGGKVIGSPEFETAIVIFNDPKYDDFVVENLEKIGFKRSSKDSQKFWYGSWK